MSKQIRLKIATPEKLVLEELVDSVTLPTTEGQITVLPRHIPLLAGLSSGDIVATKDNESIPMAMVGGFVEIKEESGITTVVILTDFAEHVATITEEEIRKAKTRAEELQKQASNKEIVDFEHFESELERSLTRIKIADKWRTKKYRK